MSLSKQLIFMLGLALLGLIAVFGVAVYKMEDVFEKTNTCNVRTLPGTHVLADMMENYYRMRLAAWKHLSYSDAKELAEINTRFDEYRIHFEKALDEYKSFIADAKDRSYYEKEKELYKQYSIAVKDILRASTENNKEKAKELVKINEKMISELTSMINEHMDYNEKLASDEAKEAILLNFRT